MRLLISRIILASMAIAALPACTVLMFQDATGKTENRTFVVSKSEDEIYGIGRVQNEDILKQFPSSVALVGRNQTYIVLQGAEQLQKVANHLDGSLLTYADSFRQQSTPNSPMDISISGHEFFGTSWFIYRKSSDDLTPSERALLSGTDDSLLDKKTGFYSFPIRVSGFIPKNPVQIRGDSSDFKVKRRINLVTSEKREVWVKYPNPFAFFVLPVAVVVDALITVPVLLLSSTASERERK